jgi:hypothetical protein
MASTSRRPAVRRRAPAPPVGSDPPPRRKWLAITLATLALVPAYWGILAAYVAAASGSDPATAPLPVGPLLAFGLCVVPFVFLVLAFLSQHPRAPGAVLRAMLFALAVGIPVSALASDAVTGLVAGVGAGGIAALRPDAASSTRARIVAVIIASALVFLLLRTATVTGLLLAPVLPFTAIGLADHVSELRRERATRSDDGPTIHLPEGS